MNTMRHYVGDVVHSFCYVCREPKREWPFLLCGQMAHAAFECRAYRNTEQYSLFISYAQKHVRGMNRFCSVVRQLEMFTNQWDERAFEYANALLKKYYGMGDSNGQ